MSPEEFQKTIADNAETINAIKDSAHNLHANVNQHYDGTLPYGFHLDMVADSIYKYGDEVCADAGDVLPLFFGAYYHDSIEDARLTYNDVIAEASRFMDKRQAFIAAEIVYALTNDKGRTRAQRAGAKRPFGQHYLFVSRQKREQLPHARGVPQRTAPLP